MAKLSSIAYYVTDKISSNDISLAEYVTTDCILQNKKGREVATNLPPQPCSLIRYQRGDVLIANIRPYLKKVWFADIDGGASPDVLVFRAKDGHSPSFLYAILLQDSFFDYVMQGTKGSKMPRGDKEQILRYEMPTFSCSEESIGTFFLNLDRTIHLNERINQNLEAMAKQLYDYWFVQFDFPDENGRPYKSSGGRMVWNEKLKREIPENWHSDNVCLIADILSGGTPSKRINEYWNYGHIPFFGPTDYNGSMFQLQTADKITESGLQHCSSSLFEENTIIITARGSIGKLVIVGTPMAMNQSCYALKSKNKEYEYLYFLTIQLIESLKAKGSGSVFKSIIASDIENTMLCVANKEIISLFCDKASPIMKQIKKNTQEIMHLTKQRDDLLPLLMNGQVSVNSDLAIFLVGFYFKYFSNFEHTISKSSFSFLIILILLSNLKSLYEITTTLIPC